MAAREPVIKLVNVWKIYQLGKVKVPALRGIDIEIYPGELVAIAGPSGSGKSTVMNMVGALDVPTRGKIYLEGKDISKLGESDLAQIRGKKIGFVFQVFNLIRTMSALENVMLPMTFQKVDPEKRIKRAKELLKDVGLSERENHKPTELSGGEQQRVAIARALANDPDVILADEPTGNLDSKTGMLIFNLLRNLHKRKNKTLVVVTHDPQLAQQAERVLNMSDGKLLRDHKLATRFTWRPES